MEDIGIKLHERIEKRFKELQKKDSFVRIFTKNLEEDKATPEQVSAYAGRLGELASITLREVLIEENLPDGKIYWNIANKTIRPLFTECHRLVNDAAIKVQERVDKENGIGLKSVKGEWPEERISALIQKVVDISMRDENE